jgi:hypothetical protein
MRNGMMTEMENDEALLRCQQIWKDFSDEEFLARVQMVMDPDVDAMVRWRVLRELRDLYDQRSRFFHTLWEEMDARLQTEVANYLPGLDELRHLLEQERNGDVEQKRGRSGKKGPEAGALRE